QKVKDKLYEVMPNKFTVGEAIKILEQGTEEASRQFFNDMSGLHPAVRNALGMGLAETYNIAKACELSAEVAVRLAELGTEAGQGVQIFSRLGAIIDTPEAAQGYFTRQVKKAEKEILGRKEVEGGREAVRDVMAEANKLFNEWIERIIGKPKKEGEPR